MIKWDCLFFQPKGKQGTKGQKQIAEDNKATLQFYQYVIGAVNVSILMNILHVVFIGLDFRSVL